jgi:choline kinase
MLDARVPPGGWKEQEQKREDDAERKVREFMDETRLWRTANSAQWVAWGIVQAKIDVPDTVPTGTSETKGAHGAAERANGTAEGVVQHDADEGEGEAEEEEFDYLGYAQERAYFFLGDCVLLGLVTPEELAEEVRGHLKMVDC